MSCISNIATRSVHCHVGSLEKDEFGVDVQGFVHCHVGSLEIDEIISEKSEGVHCHVGSLESNESKSN